MIDESGVDALNEQYKAAGVKPTAAPNGIGNAAPEPAVSCDHCGLPLSRCSQCQSSFYCGGSAAGCGKSYKKACATFKWCARRRPRGRRRAADKEKELEANERVADASSTMRAHTSGGARGPVLALTAIPGDAHGVSERRERRWPCSFMH